MARGKGVRLAVYVERPRRRRSFSNNQQRQQQQHHHLYVHRARQLAGNGGGYNRKAQLLEYSRQLRESARSQASSPLLDPKPASHQQSDARSQASSPLLDPKPASHDQPPIQIVPVKRKPKLVGNPICMDWKLLIPSFLRSLIMPRNQKEKKKKKKTNNQSTATKMKAVMKKFQVHKNRGFVSKMFASLRKHR